VIAYKLVDQKFRTRAGHDNEVTWRVGETHTATGKSNMLCTDGVIHSYTSPELGAFLNPTHADIKAPRCIELDASPVVDSDGLKQGHKSATMLREVPMPQPTLRQRVVFAILCARAVPNRKRVPEWESWADCYLANATSAAHAECAANTAMYAASMTHTAMYAAVAASAARFVDFDVIAEQAMETT